MPHSNTWKFGKPRSGHRTGKGQFSFQSQRRAMPKNVQITIKILCSFHMLVRLCSKSFKLGFSNTWTGKLPDVQAGFRKGRGTRGQVANICWIEKAKEFEKTSTSASLTMLKPLTVWITTNCRKFWKRWEYQTTWPASWETYMQVRKQQLELDMEQQTGSK